MDWNVKMVLRYFEGIELTMEEVTHFNDANIRTIAQLETHIRYYQSFGVLCPQCESVLNRIITKSVMDRLLGRQNEKTT